jgi:hypothetical protein
MSLEIAGQELAGFEAEEASEWRWELRLVRQRAEPEVQTASPKVQRVLRIPLVTRQESAEP